MARCKRLFATIAASFPEGNMSPYKRSSKRTHSPSSRFAVVPRMLPAVDETLKYKFFGSNLNLFIKRSDIIVVIIFVKEAISRGSFGFIPLK